MATIKELRAAATTCTQQEARKLLNKALDELDFLRWYRRMSEESGEIIRRAAARVGEAPPDLPAELLALRSEVVALREALLAYADPSKWHELRDVPEETGEAMGRCILGANGEGWEVAANALGAQSK